MTREQFKAYKEQVAQDNLDAHYQDLLNQPKKVKRVSGGGKRLPRRGKNSAKGKAIYNRGRSGRNSGGRNLFHKL